MRKVIGQAQTASETRKLLEQYGGFHDCTILSLVQDYSLSRVEMKLDSIGCGIEFPSHRPGVLVFDQLEFVFCRIPFVGGEVRIESIYLEGLEDRAVINFELSTTEWVDTEDFKAVDARIECGLVKVLAT